MRRVTGMPWRLRRAAAALKTERVALHHLMAAHGPGGHGALLLLLAAPCLLPVPGVGTVLGFGIAAMAWAMWCGRAQGELPARVADLAIPRVWARRVLALLARIYAAAGRVCRRRWSGVAAAGMRSWIPPTVALMALLIVLPIPFGNVLPAVALMLMGAGLVFVDGVLLLLAAAAAGVATLFPVGLGLAAWFWGADMLRLGLPF